MWHCDMWQGIDLLALLYAIKNSLIHEGSGNLGDKKHGWGSQGSEAREHRN